MPQFQVQPESPIQPHGNVDAHQFPPQQQQQQRSYPKPPPQGQYRTILPQLHTGHLQQNLETSSQVSRDSSIAESAPSSQLQSAQISPSPAAVAPNALDNPLPPLPAEAQQDAAAHDQNMAPPPGGSSSRRSQEADKAMRAQDAQMGQPPPPPGYRHGQPVPQGMPQQNPALRSAPGQERVAFDGQGEQGRNSPQPEREDPDKAFKELREFFQSFVVRGL